MRLGKRFRKFHIKELKQRFWLLGLNGEYCTCRTQELFNPKSIKFDCSEQQSLEKIQAHLDENHFHHRTKSWYSNVPYHGIDLSRECQHPDGLRQSLHHC